MSSLETIAHHVAPAILVVCRLGGLAIFAPVISSTAIPMKIKALLIALLGASTYPALAAGPLAGQDVQLSFATLGPMIAGEVLVGAITGFLALLPMVAMQMGGLLMGQQMGLGFARIYNPMLDSESDVLEQILFFLGLSSFLAVGGHEQMCMAVLRSFDFVALGGVGNVIGVGGYGIDNGLLRLLTSVFLSASELALRVSAPLMALFFLETVALGFLSKSVPALNLMNLGFPLRILMGLAVIVLGMGAIGEALAEFTHLDAEILSTWFVTGGAAGGGG